MSSLKRYLPVLQDRVRTRQFDSLFLFVTSHCNSLCRTCFYFDKLNSRDDLTLAQIDRISETAPPFHKLWISGGEPFLREELADILILFVRRNGVRHINLPTNGLLPEKIFAVIDRVLVLLCYKMLRPKRLARSDILGRDGCFCVLFRTVARGDSPPCGRCGDSAPSDHGSVRRCAKVIVPPCVGLQPAR
jgi:hypothetical protein